ncbi:MAG: ABC transporter substrate-binding protein [Spirosomaceae bacterium]|nr:ABC transporter substrate-binding protein [Spirosomataceae bacterium]
MYCIGILNPRSTLYPSIGFDILNGLKAGIKKCGFDKEIAFVTENIGFGIDEAEIFAKAEKMLLEHNADAVIAYCDVRIAELLQPMFTATNKLLVVVNPGANFPNNWQPAPTTITHTLNLCFHSYMIGSLLGDSNAAIVASYYDAGYRQIYSTVKKLGRQGGNILFNHITALKTKDFSLEPLNNYLKTENATQNLVCHFCADMATQFYENIQTIQAEHECNLYVSAMMLDELLKQGLGNDIVIKNVKGFTSWLSSLENESNESFKAFYKEIFGKEVNIFALLGWEIALLLEEYFKNLQGNNCDGAIHEMSKKIYESPRGWLKLDAQTHQTYGQAYLVKAENNFELTVLTQAQTNWDELWRDFVAQSVFGENEINSSWRNTYLCI